MQPDSCQSSHEMFNPFNMSPCLWDIVRQNCPQEEIGELKMIIGDSLVEEACDLYTEANSLLEIYQQMMAVDDDSSCDMPTARLVEAPEVRERVIQEILFLVDHLRLRDDSEKNVQSSAIKSNKAVIDYATKTHERRQRSGRRSRPSSVDSHGAITPTSDKTVSQCSSIADMVAECSLPDVDMQATDNTVEQIRETLALECEERRSYITRLQACIDEEINFHSSRTPSLKELRAASNQLEKEVLHSSKAPPRSSPVKPHPPPHSTQPKHTVHRASMPLRNQQLQLTPNVTERNKDLSHTPRHTHQMVLAHSSSTQ